MTAYRVPWTRGARLLYLAFLRGSSFAYLDDETRVSAGYSEDVVRRYAKRLQERPRTHYQRRFPPCGSAPYKGVERFTANKDHVTCRRCLEALEVLEG